MPALSRDTIRYWWPVGAWIALILLASGDISSAEVSGTLLSAVLGKLFGGVDSDTFRLMHFGLRKAGHIVEYAVLSALLFRAWRGAAADSTAPGWRRRWAARALGICLVIAASDELRQWFTASRGASILDVLLDMTAAAAVQLLIWWVVRRRQEGLRRDRVLDSGAPA